MVSLFLLLGCNLSYIVDLFAALHELASASASTLLKLTSSVRALLKPYGDTLSSSEYFVGANSKWLKYIKSSDRTWTAAEGPKKDVYNIGKLFCVFKGYVVPFFDLGHFRGQRSVIVSVFSLVSNITCI